MKKKKKKKTASQLLASLAWPSLVWSYHLRGSHGVGRGADRYAVRERGDGDSWRKRHGGHGTAQRAKLRWLLE